MWRLCKRGESLRLVHWHSTQAGTWHALASVALSAQASPPTAALRGPRLYHVERVIVASMYVTNLTLHVEYSILGDLGHDGFSARSTHMKQRWDIVLDIIGRVGTTGMGCAHNNPAYICINLKYSSSISN
jgi:hypothetical protein